MLVALFFSWYFCVLIRACIVLKRRLTRSVPQTSVKIKAIIKICVFSVQRLNYVPSTSRKNTDSATSVRFVLPTVRWRTLIVYPSITSSLMMPLRPFLALNALSRRLFWNKMQICCYKLHKIKNSYLQHRWVRKVYNSRRIRCWGVGLALSAAEKYIGQDVQVQHCRVLWEPVLATRYMVIVSGINH